MPTVEPLGPLYSQPDPPGLARLMDHLLATFPGTHSGGMYNPASNLSSGGPSPHRVTQALDVMCDRGTAAEIIRYMVSIADVVNLQQVIAWHEIITVQRWSQGIRVYPAGDHSDGNGHAHIHVGLRASRDFDASWLEGNPPVTPANPGDDDMFDDNDKALLRDLHEYMSARKSLNRPAGSPPYQGADQLLVDLHEWMSSVKAKFVALFTKSGV